VNTAATVRLALELEFTVNPDRELGSRSSSSSRPPLAAVFQHDAGFEVYYSSALRGQARQVLEGLGPSTLFAECERAQRCLGTAGVSAEVVKGVAYEITRHPETWEHREVVRQSHFHIVLRGGRPVAWAWSLRGDARAEEGTVETVPEFRLRGFGRQALAAWADDILGAGKTALFRHALADEGSRALARSLGAQTFARYVQYS
jgi:FR47-like protein